MSGPVAGPRQGDVGQNLSSGFAIPCESFFMRSTPSDPPQVMDEVLAGDALSLAEAARLVPAFRPGKSTHAATIWRWATKGVRLFGGIVVRLETCRCGG